MKLLPGTCLSHSHSFIVERVGPYIKGGGWTRWKASILSRNGALVALAGGQSEEAVSARAFGQLTSARVFGQLTSARAFGQLTSARAFGQLTSARALPQ